MRPVSALGACNQVRAAMSVLGGELARATFYGVRSQKLILPSQERVECRRDARTDVGKF